MWSRAIYTLIWSVLLLFATFTDLFNGKMDFSFQTKWNVGAREYTSLLIMAVILYLLDVVYNFIKTQKKHIVPVIIGGVIFILLFYVLSLYFCGPTFFLAAWCVLAVMKFLTTEPVSQNNTSGFTTVTED